MARAAAATPIEQLWALLHSAGYLDGANSALALPAANTLASPAIAKLLSDPNLFPGSALNMVLSSVRPPGDSIGLTGTITGSFLGAKAPAASATFTIDDAGKPALSVAATMPDGTLLAAAFSGLDPASPPALQAFTKGVFTAASTDQGPTLAFSALPLPDPAYAGLWAAPPGAMTGAISSWIPASPVFDLRTALADAAVTAGMLSLQIRLHLICGATGAAGSVEGVIASKGMGVDQIEVTLPLPAPTTNFPMLENADVGLPLTNLGQLAPLFMGQDLAALIPSRFPLGSGLALGDLQFGLGPGGATASFVKITIDAPGASFALLPEGLAKLNGISVTFLALGGDQFNIVLNGVFQFANQSDLVFDAGFSLSDLTLSASNQAPIDVNTLLSVGNIIPLPQLGLAMESVSGTLSPVDMTYSFAGSVQATGWSIKLMGTTALALEEFDLAFTRTSSALTVNLAAQTTFLGFPIALTAATDTSSTGWVFTGTLVQSIHLRDLLPSLLPFSLPADTLPDITLDTLSCSFNSNDHSFSVQTSLDWALAIDGHDATIAADLSVQKSGTGVYSGSIQGQIEISNLVLDVAYAFSPGTTDISFSYGELTIVYHKDAADGPTVAISLGDGTVGSLFDFLLSFADPGRSVSLGAPWDALEKIPLPAITVQVNLKTKAIDVEVDVNARLGFLALSTFKLGYTRQYGAAKFNLQLSGSFLGQSYGDGGDNPPLSWDPLNGSPPAVPGAGTQLLDLEYLGLGQHVTLSGPLPSDMDKIVDQLELAMTPVSDPNKNPLGNAGLLAYDAGSNWLIGTRFTLMSTVRMDIVFNDPNLYGLLIQLSGAKAGALAGLRFEILYRKVTDTIGVYHIELTLPDAMRHIEMGEVSITLPIFILDIYTNGNFRVDVGFPPSLTDFSQSFNVQVFPFTGYGGFYFAVLDGQTSTNVPAITGGHFAPVLEFGLALQVGVGKTLSLGILSGGISITVGGMLQGVLGWYSPDDSSRPSERYHHITGTVALVGEVYATVDFGIIQASVSLTVYASISADIESYKAILLEVSAGVSVTVSIKILFIRFHFSFSATITESFVIGSDSTPPWQLAPPGGGGLDRRAFRGRRLAARQPPYALMRRRPPRPLQARGRLLRYATLGAASFVDVEVRLIPLISQALASDFAFPGGPAAAASGTVSVLALLLGLETSNDPAEGANRLMSFLLDWAVDAIGHAEDSVSAALLQEILQSLSSPSACDDLFSYAALQSLFEGNNIIFTPVPRPIIEPQDAPEVPMAVMAMIPELAAATSTQEFSIDFSTDRIVPAGYEETVRTYFAKLAAQFAARNPPALSDAAPSSESLATFIFRYHFYMLAKGVVQGASDLLTATGLDLSVPGSPSTLVGVANLFNNNYTARAGDTPASIAERFGVTKPVLLAANPAYATDGPAPGELLFIPALQVHYASVANDTLAGLAACFGIDPADLKAANPDVLVWNPLPAATRLLIPAMRVLHTVAPGETVISIAADFQVDPAALAAANPGAELDPLAAGAVLLVPLAVAPLAVALANQDSAAILAADTTLILTGIQLIAAGTDSLASLATQFGQTLVQMLEANSESVTLLNPDHTIPLGSLAATTREGDNFGGLIAFWYGGVLDPATLSGANPGLTLVAGQQLKIPSPPGPDQICTVQKGDTFAHILGQYRGLTLAGLLANNGPIRLDPGQPVALANVVHTTSPAYLLDYTAAAGDTFASIAAAFFAAGDASQSGAMLALKRLNGATLTTGQTVKIPYASSIANIVRQYGVTPAALAAIPALQQAAMLAPRAPVAIPPVSHDIAAGETLAGIAQGYDLSLEQLVDQIALVPNLLGPAKIKVAAIPGMRLTLLARQLAAEGGFTNALNMASRFLLGGLRVPAPQFPNQPPPDPSQAFPLYALIGQEFPVKTPVPADYTVTLTANMVPWLSLPGGSLAMPLQPSELQRLADFATRDFQSGVAAGQVHALPLFDYVPDRQPPGALLWWQTPDFPIAADQLPPRQPIVQPSLWMMPGPLTDALAASPAGLLAYAGKIGTTASDGTVSTTSLQASRFATVIDLTIETLPGEPPGTYLMIGADQAGLQRLLALWAYLAPRASAGQNIDLYLAYATQDAGAAAGTIVSDPVDRANSFLVKTNLSTESHGPARFRSASGTTAPLNTGLIDSPSATLLTADSASFLQFLWECSTVRSGGYYLRYVTEGGHAGFPGTLFKSGKDAKIKLIVVSDGQPANEARALFFNNALLVGDNEDAGAHSLFFEAVAHRVQPGETLAAIAQQYPALVLDAPMLANLNQLIVGTLIPGTSVGGQAATGEDSFASLAARAGIGVAQLGRDIANNSSSLQPSALLQLSGEPVALVPQDATLQSISDQHDFLDPGSLATLNAATASLLEPNSSMTVPGQADRLVQRGDTFGSVAKLAGVSLAALGEANAESPILAAGTAIIVAADGLRMVAKLPPGHIGFALERTDPSAPPGTGETPQQALDTLFHLLGFQLTQTPAFTASAEGLPATPIADPQSDDGAPWRYRQILSLYPFASVPATTMSGILPPSDSDPYAGIGPGVGAGLALAFQDVLGNRTANSSLPPADGTAGAPALVAGVGYTDELVPLSAWPSAVASYRIVPQALNLSVTIRVAPDHFMPDASAAKMIAGAPDPNNTAASQRAAKARDRYQSIFYQLVQDDVECALTTTLGPVADPLAVSAAAMASLIGIASSSYVFLGAAQGLRPTLATPDTSRTTIAQLTRQSTKPDEAGYPVTLEDLGFANGDAAADLLFGEAAAITVPVYLITRPGDSARAILERAAQPPVGAPNLDPGLFADNNGVLPLAAGAMLNTARRDIPIGQADLSLAQLAAALQTTLTDGPAPARVPGLASANAAALLTENLTLVLGNNSIRTTATDTLQSAAAALAALAGGPVSSADVAVANQYQPHFFAPPTASAPLTIASVVALDTDTLAGLAKTFGAPSAPPGSPAAQLLKANLEIPGLWPSATALFIEDSSHTIVQGETLASLGAANGTSPAMVLGKNQNVPLATGATLAIPFSADNSQIGASTYQAAGTETFADIAGAFDNWSPAQLAADNLNVAGLFAATCIVINSTRVMPTTSSTFASLAAAFAIDVAAFAGKVAALPDLVREGAVLAAPAMASRAGDTFSALVARYKLDPCALAAASATLPGLLAPGPSLTVDGSIATVFANDSFALIAARLNRLRAPQNLPPVTAGAVGAAASALFMLARPVIAPPASASIKAAATAADLHPIFSLAVDLAISRDPSRVAPSFCSSPRVVSASAAIPALPFAASDSEPHSLSGFALDFEAAVPGRKLATGPAQAQFTSLIAKPSLKAATSSGASTSAQVRTLWVVNFTATGIIYQLKPASARFFAMAPLTTTAWSSGADGVAVYTYDDNGISANTTTRNFRGVDPEQWNQALLNSIDLALSPAYAAAAQSRPATAASLASLVAAKAGIAKGQSSQVMPVIGTDAKGQTEAQEAMRQQLLVTLGSAYTVESLVQVDLDVEGVGAGSDSTTAPRLSGKLVAKVIATPADPPAGPSQDPNDPFATLAAIAKVASGYLAATLADSRNLVRPGITTHYRNGSYVTSSSDTLGTIAANFKVPVETLPDGLSIGAADLSLFRASTPVNVTPVAVPGGLATVTAAANWLPTTAAALIAANAERTGFFAPKSSVKLGEASYTPQPGDTLTAIAVRFGGLETFVEQLSQVDAGALPGSYALNRLSPPRSLQLVPQMSFQSAKAPLSGGSTLTSLFTVNDPAAQRSLILDLDYRVNQLEFDIHTVEGVAGYQGSSWLTFILPVADSDRTQGRVGQLQIPIPLRGYPAPAVISGQQAADPDLGGDAQDTLAQWNYRFSATRQFAAQDEMTLEVMFNHESGAIAGSAGPTPRTAVIEALAAFAAIWPQVGKDLAAVPLLLGTPTPDETTAAGNALAALAILAEGVHSAWNQPQRQRDILQLSQKTYIYKLSLLAGPQGNALALDCVGQAIDFTSDPDDFLFLADVGFAAALDRSEVPPALRARFADYGFALHDPTVKVKAAGGDSRDWMIIDPGSAGGVVSPPQSYRLILPNQATGNAIQIWRQLLWPALRLNQVGPPLPAVQSGPRLIYLIPGTVELGPGVTIDLDFTFYRLNALMLENAWGGVSISRNADLIADGAVNDAFVYRTPLTAFPTRITPLIAKAAALALPGTTLAGGLSAFFEALLAPQATLLPDSRRDLRIEMAYWRSVDGTKPFEGPLSHRNPLVLVPLYAFDVTSDWKLDPGAFCRSLADQIEANAAAMGIMPVAPDCWVLDVMVFTSGAGPSRQSLLRIENQYLEIV